MLDNYIVPRAKTRTIQRSRRLLACIACAVLVALAVWLAYWYRTVRTPLLPAIHSALITAPAEVGNLVPSGTPSHPASLSSVGMAPLQTPPLQPPAAKTSGLATTWTFQHALSGNALGIKTVAQVPAGLVVDATSGQVLWSKNHRQKMEIASMTKMMTLLLALEAVKAGTLSLDTKIIVSKTAARTEGSQVYLKQGEVFTLGELLKSVVIKSANDSAQQVAEAVAGTSAAFVQRMNARARSLNMMQTLFYNVHGLNVGSRNTSSALDMALLARELLKHTLILQWSSSRTETFRNGTFQLKNSNPLIGVVNGVDGLKTGYYQKAGFCITFTVQRDGVRMIGVVIGVRNKAARTAFCKDVIEWSYRRVAVPGSRKFK